MTEETDLDKMRKLMEYMAEQFLALIKSNNELLEMNLRLMKELELKKLNFKQEKNE